MKSYVAMLRAVNVGGTGKLPMSELRAMCSDACFTEARTYISSGNVVFLSRASAKTVKSELERRLHDYVGKPVGVLVRTAAEIAAVLEANPFPKAAPSRTVAIFLDKAPPSDALAHAVGVKHEEMHLGRREIYVHYGDGMGTSKLRIPAAKDGTARNLNTITKLCQMVSELGEGE